jgi:ABC-type transport system involved in multi-copper enzyme maturation permease subunit
MTWLVWRQHRVQFYLGAALLAALAVLLVITGVQMASQYHSALVACAANHSCANLSSTLFLGSHAVGFLVIMTLGAPLLVGLFWGAPLVAAEIEAGTTQFAWMQSVTRRHWLTVKVGWMLLAAAVWGGVISALVTWWSGPNNAEQLNAFQPGRFDLMGAVPVAYSLFAMALGIAAGALLRRVLPAVAVTLAGFVAVRAVVTLLLRPHYMSAVTVFYKVTSGFTPPGSYWQLASGVLGPNGLPIDQNANGNAVYGVPANYLPASCTQVSRGAFTPPPSCVHAVSHFRGFLTYQPADRYWTFQGIETAIFLVLAAALIAVTAVTLVRRDA